MPSDRKFEFFEILMKESDRLNRVVEDFLRLARPQPTVFADCDVREELGNVLTLVSTDAKNRGVRLELEAPSLPIVRGDCEKLRQAFLNLVLNGLQATPRGGSMTISASVVAQENGPNLVEIVFADTGAGIPAEVADKVFEPFFTTKAGGTGLGLVITRKIVESHGGTIQVDSQRSGGAVFRIRLPEHCIGGEA